MNCTTEIPGFPGDGTIPAAESLQIVPAKYAGSFMTCIRDGWQIPADIFNHSIRMLISEEEIRSCKTTPHPPKRGSGYLKRYRAMVVSANRGAIPNEDNL